LGAGTTVTSRQANQSAEHRLSQPRRGRRLPRGVLASVVGSIIILGVLEYASIRVIDHSATAVALDEAGKFGSESVTLALSPFLTDELVALDPSAREAISEPGNSLVRHGEITHIKIWSESGVVLWSDEKSLVGQTFELDESDRNLFGSQDYTVEVSYLEKVENVMEVASGADRMLEVYVGATTSAGTPVVVEIYAPYDLVTQRAAALRREFVPVMTAALIVLAVTQLMLVLFLGRRLARSERRHTDLLERLIESSDAERRRVAAQVHDGVVQDLIGISFGLAALAESTPERAEPLSEMASSTRATVASLRSLLGSIYPIEVPPEGWVAGIDDLVEALGQLGVVVRLEVDDVPLTSTEELLILRVAREALRNVAAHAHATEVVVGLAERRGRLVLAISDNGSGFEPSKSEVGHIGLNLIHDVIRDAGGELTIESAPADGTTLTLELELAH
jgi:two-component system NarL family sensor kinase